jgi:hypothetical protein
MTAEKPHDSTPILNRLEPMPPSTRSSGSRRLFSFWLILLFALVMVSAIWHPPLLRSFFGWVFVRLAPALALPSTLSGLLGFGLGFAAANLAAVAVHELGHVLAGVAAGFRFSSLRVGRLEIHRGFRLARYRGSGAGSGGWLGGWANLVPIWSESLRWRALIMIAAGPAANLLSALAVGLAPLAMGTFSGFFLIFSAILGLGNLVPMRNRAVLSDGRRILMLLRNRELGERWLALMRLLAEIVEGVPSEALPADFVAKAIAVRDNSPDTVTAHSIAYSAAFWRHQDAEAARCLETCLRYSSFTAPPVREALMSDAAVFQARRRGDPGLASQWLAAMPEKTEFPGLRLRAEAAILEAKGEMASALRKLDECGQALLRVPNPTQREMALRFLNRWRSELEARPGSPSTGVGPAEA